MIIRLYPTKAYKIYLKAYEYANWYIPSRQMRNLTTDKAFTSEVWELFIAELLNLYGQNKKDGIDLDGAEVKSIKHTTTSVSYKYHFINWESKLNDETEVPHIYIFYTEDYNYVDVFYLSQEYVRPIIESWKDYVKTMLPRKKFVDKRFQQNLL